jgi:RNA polymerase sigma-70 factor, ECF subfamily
VSSTTHAGIIDHDTFHRSKPARIANAHRPDLPRTSTMVYSNPPVTVGPSLQFHSFDAGYLVSLCEGDRQTQDHFVGYFSALLKVKLRSRLQSRHAIEDVCQETFARVFTALRKEGGIKDPERLGAFVNSVCNNVLFETYRSLGRVESLDEEGRPEPPATTPDAFAIVSARQMTEKVREILHHLAHRDRLLLKAVFLEERDRVEVCREFGVEREYLRVLLHRAKQEFKMEYEKRFETPMSLDAQA